MLQTSVGDLAGTHDAEKPPAPEPPQGDYPPVARSALIGLTAAQLAEGIEWPA